MFLFIYSLFGQLIIFTMDGFKQSSLGLRECDVECFYIGIYLKKFVLSSLTLYWLFGSSEYFFPLSIISKQKTLAVTSIMQMNITVSDCIVYSKIIQDRLNFILMHNLQYKVVKIIYFYDKCTTYFMTWKLNYYGLTSSK